MTSTERPSTPIVYTPAEAATILRCSPSAVYAMVASGQLRAYRIGKRGIRIRQEALDEVMAG